MEVACPLEVYKLGCHICKERNTRKKISLGTAKEGKVKKDFLEEEAAELWSYAKKEF